MSRIPKYIFFSGAAIAVLVLFLVYDKMHLKKTAGSISSNKDAAIRPYRVTNATNGNLGLLGYSFHRNDSGSNEYQDCSAVIRNIDPEKDDYKTYCKSVIADIIKIAGNDKIALSIYDDNGAYELSELKYCQQYKVLDRAETDSVKRHTVAVYYGDIHDGYQNNHTLWFYKEAENRYSEKGFYEP